MQSQTPLLNPSIFESLAFLLEPDYAILIAVMVVLWLIMGLQPRKPKLAFARWAGTGDKLAALNIAMRQIQQRKHNKVTLYLGTPKYPIQLARTSGKQPLTQQLGLRFQNFKIANYARLQTLLGNPATYFITSAERGISICGSPGSGKTKSAVDPLICSAVAEALSIILYDVKGEQMRRHVAYAVEEGYEVYIFAPGFPYSGCINLLGFLSDEGDATMAREIAHVINRNAKAYSSKPDEFFGPAGDQLVELILMIAKGSVHPDLLMAWKILSLPKLAKRLQCASEQYQLDLWAEVSATSIMSVADAERTVSGIVGSAVNTFSGFIKREFLPSLVGETTIPRRLDGKQMLIFQTDETKESVVNPLIAAVLHMVVRHNMNNRLKRDRPLALFLDEFPSLYLPDIETYINRFREYGMVTMLGYQNESQPKKRYGDHQADSILAGCLSELRFNPSHKQTAANWSDSLGKREVVIKTRSRSHGKNPSHSHSEQYHQIPLFTLDDFNTMQEGECVLINPGYRSQKFGQKRTSVPWHINQIRIPKNDELAEERSQQLWDSKVRDRLVNRAKKTQLNLDDQQLRIELLNRGEIADWTLPDPREVNAEQEAENKKFNGSESEVAGVANAAE